MDDAVATVAERLRRHGRRMTVQRRAVLEAMAALGCAQDAEAIHQRARRAHGRLGLVTVYRTLEAFVAEGLAERVFFGDGRARYELQDRRHHHHLVCLGCGRVARLEGCRLPPPPQLGRLHGFRVTAHRLELFGYCRDCRSGR
ncbi:MAG: transcriptional repressor [Armatimonadota bacterium]|nr:transcriptional repressor [Armatimonadota bacterium]MDR7452695.1 transcriptional repressor [Armatimonadota bacterium]MDR7466699.1 transcriptional repressor [Armatimonadota bacterium]MDR7492827.1 transcriptional repressor [Armatimonadota bacterium]MDR7498603.1 transcriptional repressor [Armatimonadota bacterium]